MAWDVETLKAAISFFSALIALGAAITTVVFAAKNLNRERLNQQLSFISAEQKYFEDMRKWADQLSDALTEAIHLCELDPNRLQGESFFDRRHRLAITISSMIDRGRWFFPNAEIDEYGASKEAGYRGYRHEVLDGLVYAYR